MTVHGEQVRQDSLLTQLTARPNLYVSLMLGAGQAMEFSSNILPQTYCTLILKRAFKPSKHGILKVEFREKCVAVIFDCIVSGYVNRYTNLILNHFISHKDLVFGK